MRELKLVEAIKHQDWELLTFHQYTNPLCAEMAADFLSNMERVHGLLILPGYAFKSGENWMSCVSPIAKLIFGDSLPTDQQFAEKHDEMAKLADEVRLYAETKETPEGAENSILSATQNIDFLTSRHNTLFAWIERLLESALIQAWTAFETFAEDLHTKARTVHAACFSTNALSESYYFRTERTLPIAFEKAFEHDAKIRASVWNSQVKALAVLRHLLIHKRGIVDERFLIQCGIDPIVMDYAAYKEKDKIPIDGELVRRLIDRTVQSARRLLESVDEWITARTP